jgi:hypothetical protein
MRATIGLAILVAGGLMGVAGATNRNRAPAHVRHSPTERHPLIVHEWGTFTNFSGSDGIQLEFRPLVDQDLPPFVYHLSWQTSNPWSKASLVARQRMETPVTYFYSDRPRELMVRVAFPHGLLTEFYPPATKLKAPYAGVDGPLAKWPTTSIPPLSTSSLTWKVTVLPADTAPANNQCNDHPDLPEVAGHDHYAFARETDSAVVRVADSTGTLHDEKFLFYRGIGNFSLPLRLEPLRESRFRVVNDGPDEIESLFLVTIDDAGLHFCQHPRLKASSTLEAVVPAAVATSDELGERMAEALVAAGLYEKEARAMIRTWQSSWFSEPGARLFYFVPRRLTDEIIPLDVEPRPDELVRVLVGRMEALTPETASRLTAVIDDLGTCASAEAEPLQSELARLGRFAEPALKYLLAQEPDAVRRNAIEQVLARLAR